MRVLMLEPASRQKVARVDQGLDDRLVRIALFALVVDDPLALEARGFARESAVFVDGVRNSRSIPRAARLARARRPELEVLSAVTGRSVDEAGSGVVGDVIAGEEGDVESVSAGQPVSGCRQQPTLEAGQVTALSRSNASTLALGAKDVARQTVGQNVPRAVPRPIALRAPKLTR